MTTVTWAVLAVAFLTNGTTLQAQERDFLPVTFQVAWEIPPALESDLYLPGAMAPLSDGSIVLFDYGDRSVKRFSPPGKLEWAIGREGQGPGEFLGATDLRVDSSDRIWVLDRDDRVTVLDGATGAVVSTSRAPQMHRLLPMPSGGRITLSDPAGSELLEVQDGDGNRRNWSPSDFDRDMTAIQREGFIDGFRVAPTALVVFRRSGQVILLRRTDGGVEGQVGWGIEPVPFPTVTSWAGPGGAVVERPDPRSYVAARWLGHDSKLFYVGFAGESGAQNLVDVYSTNGGEYRGSLRLPMDVHNGVVVGPGMIAGLAREPVPHIQVWKVLFNPEDRIR